MATNQSSTEQISSIIIDIDGKKHRFLLSSKLSVSNNVHEFRQILSQRYDISNNTYFLDSNQCHLHIDDEELITIKELLNKDNTIQLKTDEKKPNLTMPERQFQSTEKKSDLNYVETINQSTRTSIKEIILPGSTPTYSQNTVNLPTKIDVKTWQEIFDNCTLLHGIRMDKKTPESADYPLFKFQESNHIKIPFKTKDESYTHTYMKDKEMQSSFVSSDFFDGELGISCPYIGIGIHIEYFKTKAKTNTKRTVYTTSCWNYPRVSLIIDLTYLELTSQFTKEINDIISLDEPIDQISKLEDFYKKYGHVYPRKVILGGHLYHTEKHTVENIAEAEEKLTNIETSFNAWISKAANFHISGGFDNKFEKKSSEQISELGYKAVGGDTLNSRDPTIWAKTVNEPLLWRIIEQDDYQPIMKLFNEEIRDIEKYNIWKKKSEQRHNTRKKQQGWSIAEGNNNENQSNGCSPFEKTIDNNQTIFIADYDHDRIVKCKVNEKYGQIVAGGNGPGNQTNQLRYPTDVIFDRENDSLIIADWGNRRIIRCFCQNQTTNGHIIISDIDCFGLTMDKNGSIYVSDSSKHEVRRLKRNEKNGTIVAGGNGKGERLNQLNEPNFIFINDDYELYVCDGKNNRVMKWEKGAKEGIIVAGGNDEGNSLRQLSLPRGVIVDQYSQMYVVDYQNDRVMRWCHEEKEGTIVQGGNGIGKQSNQLYYPEGLSFDDQENLYIADYYNHRIQKFRKA